MDPLLLQYYYLQNCADQRLNDIGEIIGYVIPDSCEEESLILINNINQSNNIDLKESLSQVPLYTKSQWSLFEKLSQLTRTVLDEEWVTDKTAENHFKYHCLGGGDYTSKEDEIFYDFTDKDEFDKYEAEVSAKALHPDVTYDTIAIPNFLDELVDNLNSGKSVLLTTSCGFKGKQSNIQYAFVPFATEHTTNYGTGETVNFVILTPDNKTITLYPILLSYFPTRMARIVGRNKTDTPINVQRKEALEDLKKKLEEITFDYIVENYMRKDAYDGQDTLLFPNKFFSVYAHAFVYVSPKNPDNPVNCVVMLIKSRDIREVRTKYYYSYKESQFRSNIEDGLNTIEAKLKELNQI